MSGLLRSEDMNYVRILMSDDNAYDTVREIGKFGKLHVVDLSADPANAAAAAAAAVATHSESSFTFYKKRIAACQYWERKLLSFHEAFEQYRVNLPDALDPLAVHVDELRVADVVEECRLFLEPLEAAVSKNVAFRKQHKQQMNEYMEYLFVLKFNANNKLASHSVGGGGGVSDAFDQLRERESDIEQGPGVARQAAAKYASTMCGVIPTDKIIAFERLLFRVSRGNAFAQFYEIPQLIEDPSTGDRMKKHVFAVTYMGEQLSRRISRIIAHSGATEYPLPATPSQVLSMERDIRAKLQDAIAVLERTDQEISDLLSSLAIDPATAQQTPVRSPYHNWLTALQRERAICNVMKQCEQESPSSKVLTLEGWCPSDELTLLSQALTQAVQQSQAKQAVIQVFDHPPNHATPPTYFKMTMFTSSFQGIVDTYGTPRYKEINPGVFTIISFPFLFGVMYGDIGHGTMLLIFALWMLWNERKFLELERRRQLDEISSMVFGGRYLLVMMGAFALYCGTIYNDCFSLMTNVFGSEWKVPAGSNDTMDVSEFSGTPYPYGMDPAWAGTTNELAFFNSFKMKLAVTLGVIQMIFGILLGALNNIYFKDYLALFFEFIPRLVFILGTFGYMVFIIIYKFCLPWGAGTTPPLLIQTMIQMFLSPGSVSAEDELYEGQGLCQAILLLCAVGSIPFMLFAVPCITNQRNKVYLAKHGLVPATSDNLIKPDEIASRGSDVGLGSPSHGHLKERLMDSSSSSAPAAASSASSPSLAGAAVIDDREDSNGSVDVAAPMLPADAEPDAGHGEHALGPNYSFSDHLIVQGIHTIEYVLGTVSNTASYLRLWALSLAHAELSKVFWDKMIVQYGVESSTGAPAIGFAVWGAATFCVLLCMDVLECFLHALRLHWVEFQNKFFHADGYAFKPFSFEEKEE